MCLDIPRQICEAYFGRWGRGNHVLIQQSEQQYSNMLWNVWSITRLSRNYGHPLHPDLNPDVLPCVLPLGTVMSGKESEVESAHLFLTIIQFSTHVILLLNTQAPAHTLMGSAGSDSPQCRTALVGRELLQR